MCVVLRARPRWRCLSIKEVLVEGHIGKFVVDALNGVIVLRPSGDSGSLKDHDDMAREVVQEQFWSHPASPVIRTVRIVQVDLIPGDDRAVVCEPDCLLETAPKIALPQPHC